jgi:chemotaxis protein MotB
VTLDKKEAQQEMQKEVEQEAKEFKEVLDKEIAEGLIDVEAQLNRIVIRIREKGSFPSGDARLNREFLPILAKIHNVLALTDGKIAVAGHTDNVPINTPRYRSNWELSSSRATSVVHELLVAGVMPPERFVIEGYGDTQPLAPNDTAKDRARNRRVEIIVLKSPVIDDVTQSIDTLSKENEDIDGEITIIER